MNEQKFNQLKLITDLKTAGSMTDAKFKEMKKEIDKMPDLVSAPGGVDKKANTIKDAIRSGGTQKRTGSVSVGCPDGLLRSGGTQKRTGSVSVGCPDGLLRSAIR